MPRTVEHIVATHELAHERRRAGRPIWAEKVDLRDVFRNPDMTFIECRDAIVARLKRSRWFVEADPLECDGVHDIIAVHLAHAEDTDEWDGWWDELYDLADYARVWIGTR
ncbi:hypothetical protein [Nocardia ignorata]|uniref:Uncharacterized protein n=1 Tax=Nocardia ignorata TaxID=145285 RepID=A0A4R6NZR5_NOCIG|nr:hypothetical protein [Nocardia ignorata]TDP29838.1 hypothetical protein DFR75_112107 [Nocardia ignorata]